MFRIGVDTPNFPAVTGDGLPEFRQTGRRSVVGMPITQGLDSCLNDMLRCVKVGLADL